MRYSATLWLRYLIILCTGFGLAACKSEQELIQINQDRAHTIIVALDNYESDHGTLPDSLDALVPTYLSRLPNTTRNEPFFYSASAVDGYIVSFTVWRKNRRGYGCGYAHDSADWECGYGD